MAETERSMPHSKVLPEGTVTFLFTDIQGSTQLLQRLQDQYASVLEDQSLMLRETFTKWHGHEVDTQGDSFFVAFKSTSDAVSAAVDVQRALSKHTWPQGETVQIRMGLHTGEAKAKEEGYVGIDVHRAARICSAGHGGQVLLSQTTCNLVERNLAEGVHLRDLGEHRLKDLRLPERIFQLVIADLPSDFPILKSLDALPNNLPVQLTSFVGRKSEMEQIKSLLNQGRLVTLLGPGGAGKTRLSLQIAADLVDEFDDGVWLVELGSVSSKENMVPAVASALQFSIDTQSSNLNPKNQVLDYLAQRSVLMVMDNFEHLVDGAGLLTDMLEMAPEAKVLVTSRERLNLQGEWTFDVHGMSYPNNGDGVEVEDSTALEFFTVRARQVDAEFDLSEKISPYAVRICQLVDGMPLGIELAAAWVSMLSCKEITEEIEKDLDFLTTSMQDVPDKHRSLRAVFNHSWRLLTEEQRAGFRKLSVFRGGFGRDAAIDVAGVTLHELAEFVNKSLLKRTAQGRFEIHELLRQFAADELSANPQEQEATLERHSQYHVRFLEERESFLLLGDKVTDTREEVRTELGNVRQAVHWAVANWDEEKARTTLGTLSVFFRLQELHEGVDTYRGISEFLQSLGAEIEKGSPRRSVLLCALTHQLHFSSNLGDPEAEILGGKCLPVLREMGLQPELSICLLSMGISAAYRGDFAVSIQRLEESLTLNREGQDVYWPIAGYLWLGWVKSQMGDYIQSGELYQEAYRIAKSNDYRIALAYTLSKMGALADAKQEYSEAKRYHQEALEIFVEFDDKAGQAYALSRMSVSAWAVGEYAQSNRFGREAYELFRSIGHRWGIAISLCRIGFAELGHGNLAKARNYIKEGLEKAMESQNVASAIYALVGLGCLRVREGVGARAVEYFEFALHHPVTPPLYKDIIHLELPDLESKLTPDELAAAKERGRALDLEQVVEAFLKEEEDGDT